MSTASDLTGAIVAAQSAAVVVINEKAATEAALIDATRDLNDAATTINGLTTQLETLTAENAAQTREIKRLKDLYEPEPDPPPPPPQPTGVRIGMSAPKDQWDARISETGPVQARRIFGVSIGANMALVQDAHQAGQLPVYSVAVSSWTTARDGGYDSQLAALADTLDAFGLPCAFAIEHEPSGDARDVGTVWRDMQIHCLPVMKRPNVAVGSINNGYRWSAKNQGWTDAELDAIYTPELDTVSDWHGADCYHGGTTASPGEDAGVKISRMVQYFTRKGWDTPLALGEYSGITAQAITNAQEAVFTSARFLFACIFNSNENNRAGVAWQLTGDRLVAFQAALNDPRSYH